MCNSGVCEEATADYTGVECTDYQNNTECGGKGSGYYCKFRPNGCDDSDRGDGVCTAVGSGTSIKGGAYLKSPGTMDWWSAYSWCKGNDMDLVTGTIAGIPLNSDYYDEDNHTLYNYFGEEISFWTGHDYGDSCSAWGVDATSVSEYVDYYDRDGGAYGFGDSALCQ